MLAIPSPKTFASWYISNLLGWSVGFLWMFGFWWGIDLNGFHWFPSTEQILARYIIYYIGPVLEPFFKFLPFVVCVALAQWLKFRQWKVKFNNYQWIAANIKGAFIACVIVFIIGALVGIFQRPILEFLYHDQTQVTQTNLIFSLIFIVLPLLGSISTSIIVARDVFKWKLGIGDAIARQE